jgi:hypothetical protein
MFEIETVYGDFSKRVLDGYAGILYQQGRVSLDVDGTAQTLITTAWEDLAARDVIGPSVAGVPADARNSFSIEAATRYGNGALLEVMPGRLWADGLLVRLGEPPPLANTVQRWATYLDPSTVAPGQGERDAVILEVWREALSSFQRPDDLLEPALGGPDTAERLNTSFAFRLKRLGAGETCESIVGDIQDKFDSKGTLRVTLKQNPPGGTPDCPVNDPGGYTGFEHNLYRIEIADVDDPAARRFKWSQFNGGLVGRAKFDKTAFAPITANLQAIASSGLQSFYLEVLTCDASDHFGYWKVAYGTDKVTLDSQGRLDLSGEQRLKGAKPTGTVFIRLWNGIRDVSEFPVTATPADPVELNDGIRLAFSGNAFAPGDYWTFTVRAGEIGNDPTLVDNKPPEGVHHHRVPLGVITWGANGEAVTSIDDCRAVFDPLTRLAMCCNFQVGDGIRSHGDFTTIQEAVEKLPNEGGEICVLPGVYRETVEIYGKQNVTISGCGGRSRVVGEARVTQPIFTISASRSIKISGLTIESVEDAAGIVLDGADTVRREDERRPGPVIDISLIDLHILGTNKPAIQAEDVQGLTIRDCVIEMEDEDSVEPAIFVQGEDADIDHNIVRVIQGLQREDAEPPVVIDRGEFTTTRDMPEPRPVVSEGTPLPANSAFGGIQIGGPSSRVRVRDNLIQGGIGSGITLGSISEIPQDGTVLRRRRLIFKPGDKCAPMDIDFSSFAVPIDGGVKLVSDGLLSDIVIERNHILDMGLNGIGVAGFFGAPDTDRPPIFVQGLSIDANEIRRCLHRSIAQIRREVSAFMGYGGIALADVQRLYIRSNVIADNGSDSVGPVCGVFVLHGEGMEITHNRIANNGARARNAPDPTPGPRGGVYVAQCSAPLGQVSESGGCVSTLDTDMPALRMHDNVVSAPAGQALFVIAHGRVSVQANALTSLGFTAETGDAGSGKLIGAAVMINNLGRTAEESLQFQKFGHFLRASNIMREDFSFKDKGLASAATDATELASGLGSGFVLFSDNQCQFLPSGLQPRLQERAEPGAQAGRLSWSGAISIISRDDIGVHDNQCLTRMPGGEPVLTQLFVFGDSVRVTGNRFKEGPEEALFSGITIGGMNITAQNEATHCLMVKGPANQLRNSDNLVRASKSEYCDAIATRFDKYFPLGG